MDILARMCVFAKLKIRRTNLVQHIMKLVLIGIILQILYLLRSLGSFQGNHEPATDQNLLLFWDYRWYGKETWPPEGHKIGECVVTYDRGAIVYSKAIVFHFTTLQQNDFPWTYPRRDEQLYIWWNSETPSAVLLELNITRKDMKPYNDGFFNWTMTYRLDADVVWGYGYRGDVIYNVAKGKSAVDEILSRKKRLALWITSNCNYTFAARRRMKYVDEMMKTGIEITREGSCFGGYISKDEGDRLTREHKFYFALENALHCRDYITEKFWKNALLGDAVPVVMGPLKEDLMRVAPIESFIHVDDFESPEALSKYLQYLDENDDEYRKFFDWRADEGMSDVKQINLMREKYPNIVPQERPKGLCESVLENRETKIIKSLSEELEANDPEECTNNVPLNVQQQSGFFN